MAKKMYPVCFFSLLSLSFFSACFQARERSVDLSVLGVDHEALPAIVIGGGVAGLTAAVYIAQANIPCLVIEGQKPGGALAQSHSVRNWPGVIDAPGAEIVGKIREQALEVGVKIAQEKVVSLDLSKLPFLVQTEDLDSPGSRKTYKSYSCILAMGTEPNYLGIPGEQTYWGKRVSNCAVCEGSLCKGKNVAIVGGGDAAIVEAAYLSAIAKHVTIFVRKDFFRAKDLKAKERALAQNNVSVVYNAQVKEVIGDGDQVTHLVIEDSNTGEQKKTPFDALFLAIGSQPNTSLCKNQLELDEQAFIALKDFQQTSVDGVFAAGDVADHTFVQAVTSAGQGCMAALQVKKFLEKINYDAARSDKNNAHTKTESSLAFVEPAKGIDVDGGKPELIAGVVTELTSNDQLNGAIFSNKQPVVLDLYATWCMPCQRMAPILEKLAGELTGSVAFAKINISKTSVDVDGLISKIQGKSVNSVPTFLCIKNGKEIARITGALDQTAFKKRITEAFGL